MLRRIALAASLLFGVCMICACRPMAQAHLVFDGDAGLVAQWNDFRRIYQLDDSECRLLEFSADLNAEKQITHMRCLISTQVEEYVLTFPSENHAIRAQRIPDGERNISGEVTHHAQVRSFLEQLEKLYKIGLLPESDLPQHPARITMVGDVRLKGDLAWIESEARIIPPLLDGRCYDLTDQGIVELPADSVLTTPRLPIGIAVWENAAEHGAPTDGPVVLLPVQAIEWNAVP